MKILDWFKDKKELVDEIRRLNLVVFGEQLNRGAFEEEHHDLRSYAKLLAALLDESNQSILKLREELHRERAARTPFAVGEKKEKTVGYEGELKGKFKHGAVLTRHQASVLMKVAMTTLDNYASCGRGPKVHKEGRNFYYMRKDVEEYIENKKKNLSRPRGKRNVK